MLKYSKHFSRADHYRISSFNGTKEEMLKKLWKMLSENSSMDIMREILHEELKDAEWQKDNDREISRIVESLNTKSYEEVSSDLGQITDIAHDLDDLMFQLVGQRQDTIPEETKTRIFQKWNEAIVKPQQKKNIKNQFYKDCE